MSLIQETREEKRRRELPGFRWFAVVVIAGTVITSTALIRDAWKSGKEPAAERRTIDVTGTAKQRVKSDELSWKMTVSATGRDRAAAMRRLSTEVQALREFLSAHEVQPAEIHSHPALDDTEDAAIEDVDGTGASHPKPTEFTATMVVEVQSSDLPRIVRAFNELADKPERQIAVDVEEPTCSYSGLATVSEELIAKARHDVRVRATAQIAEVGDAHLGPLVVSDLGSVNSPELGTASLANCVNGSEVVATARGTFTIE